MLTVKEVAKKLKVSAATVYTLCASGRLPHSRISTHSIRIAESDLKAYALACRSPR